MLENNTPKAPQRFHQAYNFFSCLTSGSWLGFFDWVFGVFQVTTTIFSKNSLVVMRKSQENVRMVFVRVIIIIIIGFGGKCLEEFNIYFS
jgi:hypothetical protein